MAGPSSCNGRPYTLQQWLPPGFCGFKVLSGSRRSDLDLLLLMAAYIQSLSSQAPPQPHGQRTVGRLWLCLCFLQHSCPIDSSVSMLGGL